MNAKDITKLDIEGMSREELVSLNKALIAHIITLEQQIEASERAKKNGSITNSMGFRIPDILRAACINEL